ncbi:methytransferase partner Trm112 [Salinarchaeum chitinilyticum]
MKQSTLDILRCPLDKAELDLDVEEQDGEEILDGTLTCTDCGETYEIADGIANLLPPDMREEAPS